MIPRLATNSLAGLFYVGTSSAFALIITPFLIKSMGLAAYGLIAVVLSAVTYASLLTTAIQSATGKFISQAIASDEQDIARAHYTSSVFVGVTALGIAAAAVFICSSEIIGFLSPTVEPSQDAEFFLFAAVASFAVTTVAALIGIGTFVRNRLDVKALIDSTGLVVRALAVIGLFLTVGETATNVGLAYLFGALTVLGLSTATARWLMPELAISLQHFSFRRSIESARFSSWITINQVGSLLYLQTELIVVSRFFGLESAGIYASALVLSNLVRAVTRTVSSAMAPSIIKDLRDPGSPKVRKTMLWAVTFTGTWTAIPCAALVVSGQDFFSLWIDRSPDGIALLIIGLVFHLPANLSVLPLFSLQLSLGAVKIPAMASVVLGIGNIALLVAAAKSFQGNLFAIAITGAISLLAKNLFFTVFYVSKLMRVRARSIFFAIAKSQVAFAVIVSVGFVTRSIADSSQILELILTCVAIGISGAVCLAMLIARHQVPKEN